jgi:tRNA A-37 threonylcarbamoyl transferase component Bud32
MSPCPSPEQLSRLLAEQLADPDRDLVEGHVQDCARCQDTLARMCATIAPSPTGLLDSDDPQPSPEFIRRLMDSVPPTRAGGVGVSTAGPTLGAWDGSPEVAGYEIVGELGRGGMGVVYKARQRVLDRLVALKMVLYGGHAGSEERIRFQIEAEAVARLRHPNIVAVHEVGEHQGRPFLTLEFMPGGPLSRRLAGKPLPAGDAARLAELLARAVHHAHQCGIVHRDLKPANVLLDESADTPPDSWTPKVADFGLARRIDDPSQTASGAILGTPSYMAPEQALGKSKERTVGPAADTYALGAILYEMLTGQPPFVGPTTLETIRMVTDSEPVPPSRLNAKLPRDLETICLKCLHKDPQRRYATAADLADDLASFREGRPIHARPVGAAERLLLWARRRPVVAALLAAVAVLAAAGAGSFVWAYRQALDQRDRAVRAEGERQAELARALAGSARLAARRGDWQGALRDYQSALDLGGEDEIGLRLDMLECRTALYQIPQFRKELVALASRDDLGNHAGQVRLMRGYEALGGNGSVAAARAVVRQALDLGLPAADRAYAQALLAPTVAEATRYAEAAVRHDAAHRRALELLAPLLFLQGRLREARETVVRLQVAAPHSLSGLIPQAFLLAHDGDLVSALRLCDLLEPVYGKEAADFYRDLTRLLAEVTAKDFLWVEYTSAQTAASLARFAALAGRLDQLHRGAGEGRYAAWSDFVLLRLPCLGVLAADPELQRLRDPQKLAVVLNQPGALPAVLKRLSDGWPNGYWHYLRAIFLWGQGTDEEIEGELGQALAKPTFVRVERRARFALLHRRWQRAQRLKGQGRKEVEDLARRDLRALLALGGEYPAWANSWLFQIARDLGDDATALAAARAWARQSPADIGALMARYLVEDHLGAYREAANTAEALRRLRPNSAPLADRHAVALHNQRLYRSALAAWLEALRLDPDNKDIRRNVDILERTIRMWNVVSPFLLEKLRLKEALLLALRGRHAEAVKEATALVPADAGGDALFALACVQALASRAAKDDSRLAEQYARDALASLKKARDTGYFKEPLHVEMIGNEKDLAGLAERADFQQFLRELKKR